MNSKLVSQESLDRNSRAQVSSLFSSFQVCFSSSHSVGSFSVVELPLSHAKCAQCSLSLIKKDNKWTLWFLIEQTDLKSKTVTSLVTRLESKRESVRAQTTEQYLWAVRKLRCAAVSQTKGQLDFCVFLCHNLSGRLSCGA